MRLLALASLVVLAAALVVLALSREGGTNVSAHTPHGGLNFSIGVDFDNNGVDECNSSGVPTDTCFIGFGRDFVVNVYLHNSGLPGGYFIYRTELSYSGVSSVDRAVLTWPDCYSPNIVGYTPTIIFACAAAPSTLSTYAGKMAEVVFNCSFLGGQINLIHGVTGWRTMLEDGSGGHAEGEGTTETLNMSCAPGTPTPVPDPCSSSLAGDADGDHDRDAIDGMFVLQYVAGLRLGLTCPGNANVNGGSITAADGSLILQAVAGLITL